MKQRKLKGQFRRTINKAGRLRMERIVTRKLIYVKWKNRDANGVIVPLNGQHKLIGC